MEELLTASSTHNATQQGRVARKKRVERGDISFNGLCMQVAVAVGVEDFKRSSRRIFSTGRSFQCIR